ncbi:MAG TPA: hypothetical protein VKA68_12400 [bacterium]|nr:hypothetical protein [bacterium]
MISSLLSQAVDMSFDEYEPDLVIRTVNALQPLGKEAALKQIESALATHKSRTNAYGLFWILRVLFDVPSEQGFPPVRIGKPDIPPPENPDHLPRFPIVLVKDIPLLLVHGYALAGLPQPVEEHVTYFREHGTVREAPLSPPGTMEGVEEAFLNLWKEAYGDQFTAEVLPLIRSQIDKITHREN